MIALKHRMEDYFEDFDEPEDVVELDDPRHISGETIVREKRMETRRHNTGAFRQLERETQEIQKEMEAARAKPLRDTYVVWKDIERKYQRLRYDSWQVDPQGDKRLADLQAKDYEIYKTWRTGIREQISAPYKERIRDLYEDFYDRYGRDNHVNWSGNNIQGRLITDQMPDSWGFREAIHAIIQKLSSFRDDNPQVFGEFARLHIGFTKSGRHGVFTPTISTKLVNTDLLMDADPEVLREIFGTEERYSSSHGDLRSMNFALYTSDSIRGRGENEVKLNDEMTQKLIEKYMYSRATYCGLGALLYAKERKQNKDKSDAEIETKIEDAIPKLINMDKTISSEMTFEELEILAKKAKYASLDILSMDGVTLKSRKLTEENRCTKLTLFYHNNHFMALRCSIDVYMREIKYLFGEVKTDMTFCQICGLKKYYVVPHICNQEECDNCKQRVTPDHACHLMPRVKAPKVKKYFAYDIEAYHDGKEHHPLIVCMRELSFDGTKKPLETYTWDQFMELLLNYSTSDKIDEYVFFAHNARFYDSFMVATGLIFDYGKKPTKTIQSGQKIMAVSFGKVSLLDSLNHFQGRVADLPKTFGFDAQLKKGDFPHDFFDKDKLKYVGPIPAREFFPKPMQVEKKIAEAIKCNNHQKANDLQKELDEFNEWHSNFKEPYDIYKQCVEYCLDDVEILARALEEYAKANIELTKVRATWNDDWSKYAIDKDPIGINPLDYVTTASFCLALFRDKLMPEKSIAHLDVSHYKFAKRGFYGGRTEAFKTYWEPKDKERAIYVDKNSMYPFQQTKRLIGNERPTVFQFEQWLSKQKESNAQLTDEVCINWFINNNDGYMEVDVEPPKDLYLPVLGCYRKSPGGDYKLVFSLDPINKEVYPMVELRLALEKGYKITKVYETHRYSSCNSQFLAYIELFYDLKAKNKKNKGYYACIKNILNNLWGKLGYDPMKRQTKVVDSAQEMFELLNKHANHKINIVDVVNTENRAVVSYDHAELKGNMLLGTNVAIAAYVTANARCDLYRAMDKLGHDVLYCDTDSIIAIKPEKPLEELIDMHEERLGAWKVEANDLINYVGLGPKTYAFTVESGKQKVKCKGFSTGFSIDEYKTLLNDNKHCLIEKMMRFTRDSMAGNEETQEMPKIRTTYIEKKLSFRFDKRCIQKEGDTLPWGHQDIKKIV